jgi:hypothetical protein
MLLDGAKSRYVSLSWHGNGNGKNTIVLSNNVDFDVGLEKKRRSYVPLVVA